MLVIIRIFRRLPKERANALHAKMSGGCAKRLDAGLGKRSTHRLTAILFVERAEKLLAAPRYASTLSHPRS